MGRRFPHRNMGHTTPKGRLAIALRNLIHQEIRAPRLFAAPGSLPGPAPPSRLELISVLDYVPSWAGQLQTAPPLGSSVLVGRFAKLTQNLEPLAPSDSTQAWPP